MQESYPRLVEFEGGARIVSGGGRGGGSRRCCSGGHGGDGGAVDGHAAQPFRLFFVIAIAIAA